MEIPIHIVYEDDDKDEEQKLNTQNVQYDELAKDIINIDWETKVQELDPSDAIEILTNYLFHKHCHLIISYFQKKNKYLAVRVWLEVSTKSNTPQNHKEKWH